MENKNSKELGGVWSHLGMELWGVARLFLIALVIVLPIRYYVAQPFVVRGASMEPNFSDKDYLIIDEISYKFREPKREESIIFRYPQNPQEFFIKRIIGLPGETVEIKDGEVIIKNSVTPDGFVLKQPYLDPPDHPTYPDVTLTLGSGQYFVLGDNRDFSSDSRIWGVLDKKYIVGRAIFRAWPVYKFGPVPNFSIDY